MAEALLAPEAVKQVSDWLNTSQVATSVPLSVARRKSYAGAWQLKERYAHLGGVEPLILVPRDFPFAPLRVEFDPSLCLKFPHIEVGGSLCHSIQPEPAHLTNPVGAAGMVLQELMRFIELSGDPDWVMREFQREAHDYWLRHIETATRPNDCKTEELLLDVTRVVGTQRAEALHLEDRSRAIVSTRDGGPKALADAAGWSLGTMIHGSALIASLPEEREWTPDVWPRTYKDLATLIDSVAASPESTANWYKSRQWAAQAPLFVVLLQASVAYGWRLMPAIGRSSTQPGIVPIRVSRIDRQWTLARDYDGAELAQLSSKHVVVFGCGSLGAPVIELLARAGVGSIEVVDSDVMRPENVSRHTLGIRSAGSSKASAVCSQIRTRVPGVSLTPHYQTAQAWLARADGRSPDLIVDCTGERAVRMAVTHARRDRFNSVPVLMAWLEPFGAAAHVVTVAAGGSWPESDPAEAAINVADWPDDVERKHPGCGQGYHPFGMSDSWEAAALATRRALALLRGAECDSDVLSIIRERSFFERSSAGVTFHREDPVPSGLHSVVQRRTLAEAIRGL